LTASPASPSSAAWLIWPVELEILQREGGACGLDDGGCDGGGTHGAKPPRDTIRWPFRPAELIGSVGRMSDVGNGSEGTGPRARVSYVIARLDRAIRREIAEMVAPHGLTATQYTALSVLRMGKGLSNAQLARRSYVTPQSMIEMLGTLEGKGLVRRSPAPNHGRILRTELTAKGRRLLAQCDDSIDRLEAEMTRELSPAELAAFEKTLRSCVHMLGAGLPGS
jgi:DNA-binding MarR family transcriptional regulator